jgi:type IV pilus biogenesis protein CpaD/CtpE
MRRWSLAFLLTVPALAACTTNDPTFGGAVRSNYAQQVINPEPRYEGTLVEGGEGTRSAAAVERYRTNKVKEPKSIRTTSGTGGGSGGGSGGQ